MRYLSRAFLLFFFIPFTAERGRAIELIQIISRENPTFKALDARLTVGRDGFVYLCSGGNNSYVLRLRTDGSDRVGGKVFHAAGNATANRDGVIAVANAHFGHKITLYGRSFDEFAEVADFLVGDKVGWNAPPHVEAGASGDFYGIDPYRDRVLRLSPLGKSITAYAIPREPAGSGGLVEDFRVCEKLEAFYLVSRTGPLRCVGFDGKLRWSFPANVNGFDGITSGGFDVDDDGVLHVLEPHGDTIKRVGPDGRLLGLLKLRMGENRPTPGEGEADGKILGLRVHGGEIVVRRRHPTELFQRYELSSGARKGVVHTHHERLTVTYPRDVWIAGQPLPFQIELSAGKKTGTPRWRVWARPISSSDYRELLVRDGQVQVPADMAGYFQIKVTPEIQPLLTGLAPEYLARGWVEIRQPGTRGSIAVRTPENRTHFGRGEVIPFKVSARGIDTDRPLSVNLRLVDDAGTVAEEKVTLTKEPAELALSGTLTSSLRPGRYILIAAAPGVTVVRQTLVIGQGVRPTPFSLVQYGDYGPLYPAADLWDAPDKAAAHVERTAKLGINLVVDRFGQQLGALTWDRGDRAAQDRLLKRFQADPLAPAPEKARVAPPLLQTLASYSAHGIEQMAILMGNDAGLPLGTAGFDSRKPDMLVKDLTTVTRALLPYPAFRGWSWSSNWWVFEQRGANAARSPAEKTAYVKALQRARDDGVWDPVLDAVSDHRLSFAVAAQDLFNKTLAPLAPKLVTASACPHRNVEAYPPVSLSNVQEVDLQAQWEQILLPYSVPHGVDFYKRPGKRAWTHPELWNDAGTGEQILPTLFQGVMRGADGVGFSGPLPPWKGIPEDPRVSYAGTPSIFRALNETLKPYGPWLSTLHSGDDVAIVVSGRMLRIDAWQHVYGLHFARLFEAYATCLHAHHPARCIFVEDLKPDTLMRFKAVLVVGQTVAMEPALAAALKKAREAKVRVFHDGTCRPELVAGFEPLGLSFNQFEKDPRPAEDDHAYWRFPSYCIGAGKKLARILDGATPPPAVVADPEVFLSERRAEQGRYLFVVNNAGVKIEPGLLWRTTLGVASRRPQQVPVKLRSGPPHVYDVFALKEATLKDGVVEADCRSLPARIFAVLPAAIDHVKLEGPSHVPAGKNFAWSVAVMDAKGMPIAASIPVRVRLVGADGAVLDEWFVAAGSSGARGVLTAYRNSAGNPAIEAAELFSGKTVRLPITITPAGPARLTATGDDASPAPVPVNEKAVGKRPGSFAPAEHRFGPHVKEMTISGDGTLAFMNAMNWDDNLLALDVKTGEVRWRRRLGHYFAFSPQALKQGYAVQGFDFETAEGYHLYVGGMDGTPQRRFALYGLPQRLPHRFVPGLLNDRINNFAVPTDGSWFASAGDLGLAVWNRDGKLLWSQDWWKSRRRTASLLALDAQTLVTIEGMKASAYEADTGKTLWEMPLAPAGEVSQVAAGADGKTFYVLATSDGGRVLVVRDGKLTHSIAAEGGRRLAVAPDGEHVAVTAGNQLRLYSLTGGLQWILPADDTLHAPRFSPDSKRIVACSELGSVYVVGTDGRLLLERDLGALAAPAWLADGDLLLATWMGTAVRLDARYAERWRTRLEAPGPGRLVGAPEPDPTPTTRIATWGNAEAKAWPLTPNLLDAKHTAIKYRWPGRNHVQLQGNPAQLLDGKSEPPKQAWLPWDMLGHLAEGSHVTWLHIESYRTQLRVTGITLAEDPAHPESWLRDVQFEAWDADKEQWRLVQPLLSNAAVHTHRFARPVEASRFRILLPKLMYGNIRLAQIVLHGEALGPSHPDIIAKRPVAVLFDEGEDIKDYLMASSFRFEGAFSGGRCLVTPTNGGDCYPPFQPHEGHVIPSWDFEIAENPGPGQYRYAQFAWKSLSAKTRGIALRLDGEAYGNSLICYAGDFTPQPGAMSRKIAGVPPEDWRGIRIDLWEVFKKPVRIRAMRLSSREGPAAFDQILLGRTEKDLPPLK